MKNLIERTSHKTPRITCRVCVLNAISKSDGVDLVRFTNTEWLKHETFGSGFTEESCC